MTEREPMCDNDILCLLVEQGNRSIAEMATHFGVTKTAIRNRLLHLMSSQSVIRQCIATRQRGRPNMCIPARPGPWPCCKRRPRTQWRNGMVQYTRSVGILPAYSVSKQLSKTLPWNYTMCRRFRLVALLSLRPSWFALSRSHRPTGVRPLLPGTRFSISSARYPGRSVEPPRGLRAAGLGSLSRSAAAVGRGVAGTPGQARLRTAGSPRQGRVPAARAKCRPSSRKRPGRSSR